jgi:hypothetical protein
MQGRRNGTAHRVLPFDEASAPTSAVGAHETTVSVHPTEPETLVIERKRQRRNAIDERPADDHSAAEPPAKKRCVTVEIPDDPAEAAVVVAEPAEAAVAAADDLPPTFAFDADTDTDASAYFGALILYQFALLNWRIALDPNSIPMMRAYQCFIKLFEACNDDVSLFAQIVTGPYLRQLTAKMRQMVHVFQANKQPHHHFALAGYIDDVVLFMDRNPNACPDTVKQMLQVLNSAPSNRKVHDLRILPKPAGLAIMRKYAYYYPPCKLDGSYYSNGEIAGLEWDMLASHLRHRFGGSFFF